MTYFKKSKRGFTIFFASLVASLSLAIGLAIYDLLIRELALSDTATESQFAIFAADAGLECALYWDFKCPDSTAGCSEGSAFATSSRSSPPTQGIMCNGLDIARYGTPPSPFRRPPAGWTPWTITIPNPPQTPVAITAFAISFEPNQKYCATVTVRKARQQNGDIQTTITSNGYNTCAEAAPLRVERTLQATYQ